MIRVQDMLKLGSCKRMTNLCGESGMYRRVSWPNIAQTDSIKEWLVGGDAIIMSGIGMEVSAKSLINIVEQATDKHASCLIVLISDEHIKKIPDSVIEYAKARDFAIIAAPWDTMLSYVIRDISEAVQEDHRVRLAENEFVEKLILGKIRTTDKYDRLLIDKYRLMGPNQVIVVYKRNTDAEAWSDIEAAHLCRALYERFDRILTHTGKREIVFILGSLDIGEEETLERLKEVSSYYNSLYQANVLHICMGQIAECPEKIAVSYTQAQNLRELDLEDTVVTYKNLGTINLLLQITNASTLDMFVTQYVGRLKKYDGEHGSDLLCLLYAYINNNCSIMETAEKMYIHRNTMQRKLEKIEEVLGVSLKMTEVINNIYTCYLIDHYIKQIV